MIEKTISIVFIIMLSVLAIVCIIGAIMYNLVHPYYIAAISALISFMLWNQDVKKLRYEREIPKH